MNLALLILEGTDEALDLVVRQLELEVEARWKKGEKKLRGGEHESSGLNVTIADAPNPGQMIRNLREFAKDCEARRFFFSTAGLSAEVSIGVTVGDSKQYIAFVDLSPADMMALGSVGLALSIAAYPTSDEANEADEPE